MNRWVQYVQYYKEKNPDLSFKQALQTAKKSYKENKIKYGFKKINTKINAIDKIYWINLDRSLDRKINMDLILKGLNNIPNERISASDGASDAVLNNFILKNGITQKNIVYACLLSHLRAVKTFWESGLQTALILEDDTSLHFVKYWEKDLNSILQDAPEDWDIVMMSYSLGTRLIKNPVQKKMEFKDLYNPWLPGINSTAAYIINRTGAEKIMKLYKDTKWAINDLPHVSDHVIYKNTNTYVYKYAYFTGLNKDSTIHNDDLWKHKYSTNFSKKMWIDKKRLSNNSQPEPL